MPALRVLAGSSVDGLETISSLVNKNEAFHIKSDAFEGDIVVNIKGFNGDDGGDYFDREDRRGITWSIQVQGQFLERYSANDILFGNTFDRPLNLPWGSGAALKFMNYVDPTLEHDLNSPTRPWALSPLVATMPHFSHTQAEPPSFPPSTSVADDNSNLHLALASANPTSSTTQKPPIDVSSLQTATQRRSFFASASNRSAIIFGPDDVITTDFCYGFLEFHPSLALRLPGGVSFDLMRYWDGQPVRFVCCERGNGKDEPVGRVFWCISIEAEDDEAFDNTEDQTADETTGKAEDQTNEERPLDADID